MLFMLLLKLSVIWNGHLYIIYLVTTTMRWEKDTFSFCSCDIIYRVPKVDP